MTIKVGNIGLGPMGGHIARLLLETKFDVIGFDINSERMLELEKIGMELAFSVLDLADEADVIITSLPSFQSLTNVIDELVKSQKNNQIIIECSTLEVEQKMACAKSLQLANKVMLDAPISATPQMLAKGQASIHIGGDREAYDECVEIFDGFVATKFYVGGIGDGSRMKILANYLVHVHTVAAAECITLGQKAGLDPELVHKALEESAGNSKMHEVRGKMMAENDYREGGGTMFEILEKDSQIITKFAAKVKAPIELYCISQQKFSSAMAKGLQHLDTSAVCKAIEISAGIDRESNEE